MTENENKHYDLQPRSQRKYRNISETFAFVSRHSISHDEVFDHNFYDQTICSN